MSNVSAKVKNTKTYAKDMKSTPPDELQNLTLGASRIKGIFGIGRWNRE